LECVSLAVEGRAYEKSSFVCSILPLTDSAILIPASQRSRPWPGSVFATGEKFARKRQSIPILLPNPKP